MHIYKLSMIASLNRDNAMTLLESDFFTALEWLAEVEHAMPDIFKAGASNADAQAMDDIIHFIKINDMGSGVSEQRIVAYAASRIPLASVHRVIDTLAAMGKIFLFRTDLRAKVRFFTVTPPGAGGQRSHPTGGPTHPTALQ